MILVDRGGVEHQATVFLGEEKVALNGVNQSNK